MSKPVKKKNEVASKPIRTIKDLWNATVKKDATFTNGGFDLFSSEIRNYLVCKDGSLMTWDDWYKKPHPSISPTEDADFEIIDPPSS